MQGLPELQLGANHPSPATLPYLAIQASRRHILSLFKQRPRLCQIHRVALRRAAQGRAWGGVEWVGRRWAWEASRRTRAGPGIAPTPSDPPPAPAAVHQCGAIVPFAQVYTPHVSVLIRCIHLQGVIALRGCVGVGVGVEVQCRGSAGSARPAQPWHSPARNARHGLHPLPPSHPRPTHPQAHRCVQPAGHGTAPAAWWPRHARARQTAAAAPPVPLPCWCG